MVNKNTIIAIILIIIAITLIGLGVVIALKDLGGSNIDQASDERLFIVEANGAYGVMTANGTVIAQPQFSKITRINNIIYLKSDSASYLYNILSKETVTLDGFETNIKYIKTDDGFSNKYILQYGETDNDAIYRIIDEKGNKVTDKDFASISSIYSYLELIEPSNFTPKTVDSTSLNKTDISATLSYPSPEGKSQYIIKETTDNVTKYGIVDENNKQIVEPVFDKIEQIKDSNKACLATKGDLEYVILDNGTTIETQAGFEFDYNEDGYVIQKRGSTGNKIYNLNGDVILDRIFNYPAEIVTLNSANAKYMLLQDPKTSLWSMYNMDTAEKLDVSFSNLIVDYLKNKDINVVNTTFMYKTASSIVGVDLATFKTYNISIPYSIVAPLESGVTMNIADSAATQQQ